MEMVETTDSMLSAVGRLIAPIFIPLGFGNWQSAVATITGFVAKENVVGTFGVLYGLSEATENGQQLWTVMAANFTALSAYAFMAFNLICAPCFAAVGAISREMKSLGWSVFAIGYQTVFAYSISLIIYQIGSLIKGGEVGIWTIIAITIIIAYIYFAFCKKEPMYEIALNKREVFEV